MIKESLENAKESTWLTDGLSESEINEIKEQAIRESEKELIRIRQATKQGWIECEVGGVADLSYPDSKLRRGRVQGGGGE